MTGVGVLLGTAAYMSPEQAHGRSADRRSDIFSFGAVLYEMLSGRRAFTGDSVSDTLASVLKIEPDWSALPSHVPPSISHVLRRCLMKDRRQRLQSIGEARIVFENPVEQAVSVSAGQPWWWIAATALLATIAGVALWGWLGTTPPESPPSSHFAVALPPAGLPRPRIAISPDGSRVAYPTIRGIYLRAMDRPEPQLLPNTQTATGPIAFSPDGQSLVFVTGQGGTSVLKRISFNDGRAEDLVGVHADSIIRVLDGLLHWGLDDHVYFADGNGLRRVSAHGASEPEIVLPASAGLYFPVHLLRDRNVLLIAGFSAAVDSIGIDALDLQTRQKSSVLSGLARAGGFGAATYVTATGPKQGHIVYGTAESVHAVPFDEERLQASGPAVAIPDVSLPLSVSAQGALVYVQGADAEGGTRQLAWVNTQGVEVPIPGPPRAYSPPLRLSPQGDTLAVSIAGDLWTIDLLAGRAVQITTEEFTGNPVWSRDGKKLFYTTGTRPSLDRRAIAWVSADRSTQPVTLTSDDGVYVTSDVAQGGAILARRENPKNPGAGGQYLSFPISPDGTRLGEGKPFLASRSRLQNLRISPSGEFVAYQALESGRTEVEVAPYPGPGGIVRISTDEGGAAPQWSEDGRQLFYVSNGNKLMVVDVLKSSLEFVASAPKMVLENFRPPYAVARGRFLKFQLPGANQPDELHIVTNWVDTLRRLAPAK
jgi:hypothetical protein